MEEKNLMRLMIAALVALLTGFVLPGWAQTKPAGGEKPANTLETVHEKLKTDKKSIVTKYMELTDSEAKNFWPVYEDYQKDLEKINERLQSRTSWIPGRASYRQLARNDDRIMLRISEPGH